MRKIFIINGHQPYPYSKGELNGAFITRAKDYLASIGSDVRLTEMAKGYDVENEVTNHQWADIVIMQFPINWMGLPWSFKKYIDDVYNAGAGGRLWNDDGRTSDTPKKNYGTGGCLTDTTYMLSVTLNAPKEAFDDASEPLFAGRSLDDLLAPTHFNARFLGMAPLPTFAAFDVVKNPDADKNFARFEAHLRQHIPASK